MNDIKSNDKIKEIKCNPTEHDYVFHRNILPPNEIVCRKCGDKKYV